MHLTLYSVCADVVERSSLKRSFCSDLLGIYIFLDQHCVCNCDLRDMVMSRLELHQIAPNLS